MKIVIILTLIVILTGLAVYFLPAFLVATSKDADFAKIVSNHIKEQLPEFEYKYDINVRIKGCFPVAFGRIRLNLYVEQSKTEVLQELKRWAQQEARESINNKRKVKVEIHRPTREI